MPRYAEPDDMTTFRTAYEAFRSGRIDPEMQAYASAQIERSGIRPIIDRVNAQIAAHTAEITGHARGFALRSGGELLGVFATLDEALEARREAVRLARRG